MSKIEKLIDRLKSNPKDFDWSELIKVLNHFGYELQVSEKQEGLVGNSLIMKKT